jgi:hypothetical protein
MSKYSTESTAQLPEIHNGPAGPKSTNNRRQRINRFRVAERLIDCLYGFAAQGHASSGLTAGRTCR